VEFRLLPDPYQSSARLTLTTFFELIGAVSDALNALTSSPEWESGKSRRFFVSFSLSLNQFQRMWSMWQ
jgi:hypothetical protein